MLSGVKRSRNTCGCLCHSTQLSHRDNIHAVDDRVYYTYIVASRSHTLYVGVTGNLCKRVFEHKWREHDGFTEKYNCDRLVWFEIYQDVQKAIAREKQLKGWRRSKKIWLIEKMNPAWVDLSREWYDVEPADLKRATEQIRAWQKWWEETLS
jgi:putative endonuclease